MTNLTPMPVNLFGFDDEDRKAANERRALAKGLEPCTHCGRGVAVGAGFVVIIVGGGANIAHPGSPEAEDVKDPGFMGAWVLGSTCAKQVPAEFRVAFKGRS